MELEDLDFPLPEERVAIHPPRHREDARLLVAQPGGGGIAHRRFRDLPTLLADGDLLVFNDTRVVPARFVARKSTGGKVEGLWLADGSPQEAECLLTGNRLAAGTEFETDSGVLRILEGRGKGRWILMSPEGLSWREFLQRSGRPPLPPYIRGRRRALGEAEDSEEDAQRYQTIWAEGPDSVAAPTASLHFDEEVLCALKEAGIGWAKLTLEVGPGTFLPVESGRVEDHLMHAEKFKVPSETEEALAKTRSRGGRVVAAGTTVCRVLETLAHGGPSSGETDLFILPGHEFRGVDALLTNFHTPRSTLLGLVGAFADYLGADEGLEWVKSCYGEAVREEYRFYSYGDCSLWK